MLYWLAQFAPELSVFNVFRYITFRTGGALITALLFVFLFGPKVIRSLRFRQGKGYYGFDPPDGWPNRPHYDGSSD